MEFGLVLTENSVLPGWTMSCDSQPSHFYNGGSRAPPNFRFDLKLFKYGHVIYNWKRNFMLIKENITTWGQKSNGKIF